MPANALVARALAAAFLAGPLKVDQCVGRGAQLLGRSWRWLRPLAQRVCESFRERARPRQIELAGFLRHDQGFRQASERYELKLVDQITTRPAMSPVAAAGSWDVPAIRTPAELGDWLEITLGELDWFADLWALEYKRSRGRLRHYHYRILAKRFGQVRLIEAPKARLKAIQRRILTGILDRITPHASVHGFRRGRSVKTFAAVHTGKHIVLRLDLRDFFPSIRAARIQALFRTAGYPDRVADLLAGLCTNAAPQDVWEFIADARPEQLRQARRLYAQPHLPQGAPTSPALANLAAYRLDCRLAALAASAGASYTRYADDLAFSGGRDFARVAGRFHLHVAAIVMQEGFAVHHRKTRIMRQGVRQRLAGIVVNRHTNVVRADYDRLKATLTNCIRHGAESQNRTNCADFRAHLLGRISFVDMLNPHRGARLRALFERIVW
jgi:hypothetical protein